MPRHSGLVERYGALSFVVGHAILVLVALNLVLSALFRTGEVRGVRRFRSFGSEEALRAVYPGRSLEEIDALLRETESRPKAFEAYTGFKERPFAGRFVNVLEAGFRLSKSQGPWPLDRSKFNVFVFGGSTIFGYGVPDAETVPSFLGERLSALFPEKEPRVYNFGREGYYSVQERVLFEKLLASGSVPDVAVFIDGLNDPELDEPYFSQRLRETFDAYQKRWPFLLQGWLRELPLGRAVASIGRHAPLAFGARARGDASPIEADPARVAKVIERFLANKTLIGASAKRHGVTVAFVWQPVHVYKYDLRYHLFRWPGFELPRCRAVYERMAEIVRKQDLGPDFLWCADMQEGLKEPLYVDPIHYTARMSDRVADLIVRLMAERGLLPGAS